MPVKFSHYAISELMSRTNDGLRLSLVVKCLIVINLSMHEDISIVHLKFDYGLENSKGIRYVYNVILILKTWSRYFFRGLGTFGGSLFSVFIRNHKVFTLLSGGRYFRSVVTIGTLRCTQLY